MNEQLNTMRKALLNYKKAVDEANENMALNKQYFQQDKLEEANKPIKDKLEKARKQAEATIRKAQEDGRAKVRAWGKLDGDKITSDAKLLDYGVTPEQFGELVTRYEDNGTMLTLLKTYADKKNADKGKGGPYYDATMIPSVQERENAYDAFASSALDLLSNLSGKDDFFMGANSPMTQTAVEKFGEETGFNTNLISLL